MPARNKSSFSRTSNKHILFSYKFLPKTKIEASRSLYHEKERPPKAWDIVRLFQLRILTVEDNGMFMDKYRVDGNSNYIRIVDEDAIFDFQEQEMIRLRLPKGMKPPMTKKTFSNCELFGTFILGSDPS